MHSISLMTGNRGAYYQLDRQENMNLFFYKLKKILERNREVKSKVSPLCKSWDIAVADCMLEKPNAILLHYLLEGQVFTAQRCQGQSRCLCCLTWLAFIWQGAQISWQIWWLHLLIMYYTFLCIHIWQYKKVRVVPGAAVSYWSWCRFRKHLILG